MATLPGVSVKRLGKITRVLVPCTGMIVQRNNLCATLRAPRLVTTAVSTPSRKDLAKRSEQAPQQTDQARLIGELPAQKRRVRVVVVGSGWASVSFVKNLDPAIVGPDGEYDVTLVSPRAYFLYTPLLPSTAVGTVDDSSIAESVRSLIRGKGSFAEAEVLSIDPQCKRVKCLKQFCEVCAMRKGHHNHTDLDHVFELEYDVLVMGVGSVNNTFGVQGVKEHCFFLKTMEDARNLRAHVSKLLEQASLPGTAPEDRARMLSFVVVGGGPSGVEVAAELYDLMKEDVARLIPGIKDQINITLVHTEDHLLNAYDRDIAEYTTRHFERSGVQLQLDSRVKAVTEDYVLVQRKGSEEQEKLPYGTVVWCTGITMHPLARALKDSLPQDSQGSHHSLQVDDQLLVQGAQDAVFAIGDCATINKPRSADVAEQLFSSADKDGDGAITRKELEALLKAQGGAGGYPQLREYLHYLRGAWRQDTRSGKQLGGRAPGADLGRSGILDLDGFKEVLLYADQRLRPLPATAQVARQQGEYLARIFKKYPVGRRRVQEAGEGEGEEEEEVLPASAPKFSYLHMGSLAYIGADQAVMKLPFGGPTGMLKGWLMGQAWRGMETFMQISQRNQFMVAGDFLRTKVFGRNLSDI